MAVRISEAQPVYHQVALDLAVKIAAGKYAEGQRLSGRSTLASGYGVSPETVRRAVYLLKDVGIVDISKGSGIRILSRENAAQFVKYRGAADTAEDLKRDILASIKRQEKESALLFEKITRMVDLTDRFKNVDPLTPFTLEITDQMRHIGRTSAECMFWHNTGATIVAYKRGDVMELSPGPHAAFEVGDLLYFVGDESAYLRVVQFFRREEDGE